MPGLNAASWPPSSGFLSRWIRQRREQFQSRISAKTIVLFSDPDTLREPGSREWTAMRPLVEALDDEGVAVVLWGNETRSEMELIQTDLNLRHPFISENGGGLFVRHGYFADRLVTGRTVQNYHVVEFGKPYSEVANALHDVARRVQIELVGFSDMSIEEVARHRGLTLPQARLAKLREYDEPFRIIDSQSGAYRRVCGALRRLGFRCFAHEAFHHATGVADRAQSIRTLSSLYRQAHDGDVVTVGLAKEPSETCLLQAVDIPIVIESEAVDPAGLGRRVPAAHFGSGNGNGSRSGSIAQLIHRRFS